MIDVGRMNKKITFMEYTDTPDELGQSKQGYEEYKTVWASVEPISSKEIIEAGKYEGEISHRIYIRFRNDITTDMLIKYKDRKFEISAPPIDTKEEHVLLTILCREKVGEGW